MLFTFMHKPVTIGKIQLRNFLLFPYPIFSAKRVFPGQGRGRGINARAKSLRYGNWKSSSLSGCQTTSIANALAWLATLFLPPPNMRNGQR